MKIYAIKDNHSVYGYIFSDNYYDNYYIEINDEVQEQGVFFNSFLEKGKKVINNDWAKRYVNERAIPANRQNISSILKNSKMSYYNELLMFIKAKGKSSMDNYHLEEIKEEELVDTIKNRRKMRIIDFIFDRDKLIIFFMNDVTKVYRISDKDDLYYAQNEKPFLSIFGEEIVFNSKVRYTYDYLYANGKMIDLSYQSIKNYVDDNVFKTSDVSMTLGCSRQYVHQLREENRLKSISSDLFLKNDVRRFMGD